MTKPRPGARPKVTPIFAAIAQPNVRAEIVLLLDWRSPPNVRGLVIAVIVDAVQRMAAARKL